MVASVQSVVRAMSVLTAFGPDESRLTLAQVSERIGLPRGTTHRMLSTFETLGYIRNDGGVYELTSRVLDIGFSYLASQPLADVGRTIINQLSDLVDEHSSVGVLDGDQLLIIAATPVRHQIAVSTRVGSRLPLATSASGRALLSGMDETVATERCRRGGASDAEIAASLVAAGRCRELGYSVQDEALGAGLVSVAAPVRTADGQAIAAIAVAAPKVRHDLAELEERVAPHVVAAAEELGRVLVY